MQRIPNFTGRRVTDKGTGHTGTIKEMQVTRTSPNVMGIVFLIELDRGASIRRRPDEVTVETQVVEN